MSPKELLYIEDALGHEKFMIQQCSQALGTLNHPQLRDCVTRMKSAHQDLYNQFCQLL